MQTIKQSFSYSWEDNQNKNEEKEREQKKTNNKTNTNMKPFSIENYYKSHQKVLQKSKSCVEYIEWLNVKAFLLINELARNCKKHSMYLEHTTKQIHTHTLIRAYT